MGHGRGSGMADLRSQRRPGRPRKPDGEKLQPLSTNVSPEMYAMLCRIATRRRITVADVVRGILAGKLFRLTTHGEPPSEDNARLILEQRQRPIQ